MRWKTLGLSVLALLVLTLSATPSAPMVVMPQEHQACFVCGKDCPDESHRHVSVCLDATGTLTVTTTLFGPSGTVRGLVSNSFPSGGSTPFSGLGVEAAPCTGN